MSETVTLYKCNDCKEIIIEPKNGLVIQGNIYLADPMTAVPLIRNNFPNNVETFSENSIGEHVLCVPCFLKAVMPTYKLTASRGFFNEPV